MLAAEAIGQAAKADENAEQARAADYALQG
jgi:hypothetical protein